jgi:ADP-ribosylarginine hydrolase
MAGRAPGNTCGKYIKLLKSDGSNWKSTPYSERSAGCGGSMRSACIGLVYHNNIEKLIQVSIEAGRLTHNMAIGYLGSMVSSYFTALALK